MYYRRFIPRFADLARPLTQLNRKGRPFKLGQEQQSSFEELKRALTSSPLLSHPDYSKPMEIHSDASGYGLGAVLVQRIDGKECVISYASRLLSKCEKDYSVTEQECLALVFAVRRFRAFIWGINVKVVTDHHSLCWLFKKKELTGRLARWSMMLQDLNVEIVHRNGKLHLDADALSRAPVDGPEAEDDVPMLHLRQITDTEELARQQGANPFFGRILSDLKEEAPTKRRQHMARSYELRGGVLHRRIIKDGQEYCQLCVPDELRTVVLKACHDDITSGHLGVTRTLDKVSRRFF